MQKINHRVIFLSAIIFVLINPWCAFSAPREVTLFPDSALVTEVTKVRLSPVNHEQKKAVFHLPAKADPTSLVCGFAQPTKMQIDGLSWRQFFPDDDEALKTLRRQLQKMLDEKNDMRAYIQALESQIQFWQLQTKARAKNTAEAAAISAALGRNLKILYKDKVAKEAESAKAEKRIVDYRGKLNRQEKSKEALWEVTLLLSGPQVGEPALKYSYLVGGCGWTPQYRIEANTQAKQIAFKHEANVWQNTATDWNQVALRIAAHQAIAADKPPDLKDGMISEQEVSPKVEKGVRKAKALKTAPQVLNADKDTLAVHREVYQFGAFTGHLGVVDLPAKSMRKVTIKNDLWPADFSYLLRPSLSPYAFIKASVQLPAAGEFPAAEAHFVIDGSMAAKRTFSSSGQEVVLFFGVDPQVTADRRLLKKSTVQSDPDRKIEQCAFLTEVTNAKSTPVKILIEEPLPRSTDETGKQTYSYDPAPSEQDGAKAIWSFELPAGGKKAISAFLRCETPINTK